jgi:hypothetical protein
MPKGSSEKKLKYVAAAPLAATFENLSAFGSFQISHKTIFMLQRIFSGSPDLPMFGGGINFAYDKTKPTLFQGGFGFALERIQIAHRRCQLDAAILRYGGEIRFPRGCAGLTDPGAAIDLVVENEDRKIRRIEIT